MSGAENNFIQKDGNGKYRLALKELRDQFDFYGIIGESNEILKVLNVVSKVCKIDSTVLITGENGTGKELIARAIHANSKRKDKPLITLNCGAIPENLHESELFGHSKGAFTNAFYDKTGLLEEAHGGTLLLDEVRELSPSAQVKMLRFLQDGEIRKIGTNIAKNVDVRVVAVTNGNLKKDIRNKVIREDFYYRLNVIRVDLLPLRERVSDIPVLIDYYMDKYRGEMQKPDMKIAPKAVSLLMDYSWPGNIRELKNVIERAVVLNEGTIITQDDLPEEIISNESMIVLEKAFKNNLSLSEVEKGYILKTLEKCGGSKKRTADLLGITKTTLWRKLKEFDYNQKEQIVWS